MSKKCLLPLVGLMILACNFLSPKPSDTPDVGDPTETVVDLPTKITHPADCVQLNLTREECANAGEHSYSLSNQLYPSCEKAYADWDPGSKLTITLIFSDDTLDIFPMVAASEDHDTFTRDKPNQFSLESDTYDTQHMHHKRVLTFTKTGFTIHYAYLSSSHPYRDCWELTYTIER